MEKAREGMALVFGANGKLVAVMSEMNARLVVEGVNARMEAEAVVYEGVRFHLTAEEIRDIWRGEDWL
jgi:hypothetical protein